MSTPVASISNFELGIFGVTNNISMLPEYTLTIFDVFMKLKSDMIVNYPRNVGFRSRY